MVPRKIASILLALPLFAALYAVFSADFNYGLLTAVVLGPMFMFVQVFLYGLPAMLLIEWVSSFSPAYKTICILLLHVVGAFVFSLFLAPPFSLCS
ncbi:hypothetical protein [Alkalicoccus urumqiensis]|uniref:Uncharacterized protein n=1 Tax=Alkalicoccus urumqiensis TaxID=1548213 RepID=A0A2P6MJK0_ALKUR|nr:hypothetical protein [Alkalicoccus urumqiensis]PRO66459.1 hypothetical protein C6I21_03725 [Alkalicoccus urumqiensis]